MIKLKRRHFIQGVVASGLLGLFYSVRTLWNKLNFEQTSEFTSKERLSILQGATSDKEAQISICYLKELKLKISVMDSTGTAVIPFSEGEREHFKWIKHVVRKGTHDFLTLIISNLSLGETYTLVIKNDQGEELDYRQFKTLDVNKREAACALISCAHDRQAEFQERMWKRVESAKFNGKNPDEARPDVLFLLGDNVYIDWYEKLPPSKKVDEDHLWKRTIDVRNLFYLYKMPFLIPTFAIWDDHDTGANDSYKDNPLNKEAAVVFDVAFPRYPMESLLVRTDGIGYYLKLFGLEVMMMDSHSFCTLKEDPKPSHWGDGQEKQMEQVLRNAQAPVWIMNGNQFFGAYRKRKESYELVHPTNFYDWFLKEVRASAKPVLLTSGDIHYSEIQRIEPEVVGYPLYEMTSSSIHSNRKALKALEGLPLDQVIELNVNERRVAATGEFNFVLAQIKTSAQDIKVTATSMGLDPKPYFEHSFVVSK